MLSSKCLSQNGSISISKGTGEPSVGSSTFWYPIRLLRGPWGSSRLVINTFTTVVPGAVQRVVDCGERLTVPVTLMWCQSTWWLSIWAWV